MLDIKRNKQLQIIEIEYWGVKRPNRKSIFYIFNIPDHQFILPEHINTHTYIYTLRYTVPLEQPAYLIETEVYGTLLQLTLTYVSENSTVKYFNEVVSINEIDNIIKQIQNTSYSHAIIERVITILQTLKKVVEA